MKYVLFWMLVIQHPGQSAIGLQLFGENYKATCMALDGKGALRCIPWWRPERLP